MPEFEFAIIASGKDLEEDGFLDALFEAGGDDATLSFQKGVLIAEFTRDAPCFSDAVASACQQVHAAGAHIKRVEPDHLVSLSEIAERARLTRQAIFNYAKGDRQDGFPSPSAKVSSKHPLWDWPDVATWLFNRKLLDGQEVTRALIVKEANEHLDIAGRSDTDFAALLRQHERH